MLIYKQMPKIIAEIAPIAKERKNQQQGYSFRGIDDVYSALNGLLAKHEVTIIPALVEQSEQVWDNAKGNKVFRVQTTFDFHFYASDGSSVTARVPSEAMDTGDKATPKALSMAYKYMAFQVFCIPIDEQLDTENHTHEVAKRAEDAPPKRSYSREAMPLCPNCGNEDSVIKGKEEYGGGWVCFKKKGGCGHTWKDVAAAAAPKGKAQPMWEVALAKISDAKTEADLDKIYARVMAADSKIEPNHRDTVLAAIESARTSIQALEAFA